MKYMNWMSDINFEKLKKKTGCGSTPWIASKADKLQ
jgi:hypothetical protein